ncbi:MAG: AraC family transcriptional regulator [Opitutaceae bacterium]
MNVQQNLVRELIQKDKGATFIYKQEQSIWPVWHYHEEIDILLFLQSRGQHITGDYIGEFGEGTLLVNGPNVPHCFTSNTVADATAPEAAIVVIQFSEKSIGNDLLSKPELSAIKDFLQSTSRSFEYSGETRAKAASIMMGMKDSQNMERFSLFLKLLETFALAPDQDKRSLVSEFYSPVLNDANVNRIEVVRRWVQENLCQNISLEAAAAQVQMPAKSFSYFFKKNTGKAFVQYVKELRIGLASQKLLQTDLSVLEICYACGYNNLSNFNRQFRDVKNSTPTTYRKQFKDLTGR